MKNIRLILTTLSAFILLLSISGCCDKQKEIVYVKTKCPRLKVFEINKTVDEPFILEYEIEKESQYEIRNFQEIDK